MLNMVDPAPPKPIYTSNARQSEVEKPAETYEKAPVSGPRRRAPMFYAGETYGRRRVQYPDVERYANGVLPSKRNKIMRRLIRSALKRKFSTVETALKLPRAMLEQARLIAKENGKSSRWARALFAKELAIHQPAYVPADLRAERAERRRLKRAGKKDAIAQLVDRMAGEKR